MKHGANIYKYAKKLGCHHNEILDFSSNINMHHPDIQIIPTQEMLVKYSDSTYSDLKKTITTKYPVKKKQIALYNGATSAIFELFKTLYIPSVYLYAPLYGEYEKSIPKNVKTIKINRFDTLMKKPKKNAVVVFVNPSTPDGKYYDLEQLFKLWKKQNCTIVIDESFLDFEMHKSMINQIDNYKKLYIIKSFTKFYSCAGVRVGAIFSNKKNIKKLELPLWNLSSFDVSFLTQRLQDSSFSKKSCKLHKVHKKELKSILEKSALFDKVFASDSNFIMVKSKKAKKIFRYLLKRKILVRTCESFDFLDTTYLRFGVKSNYMHARLKKAFEEFNNGK